MAVPSPSTSMAVTDPSSLPFRLELHYPCLVPPPSRIFSHPPHHRTFSLSRSLHRLPTPSSPTHHHVKLPSCSHFITQFATPSINPLLSIPTHRTLTQSPSQANSITPPPSPSSSHRELHPKFISPTSLPPRFCNRCPITTYPFPRHRHDFLSKPSPELTTTLCFPSSITFALALCFVPKTLCYKQSKLETPIPNSTIRSEPPLSPFRPPWSPCLCPNSPNPMIFSTINPFHHHSS